MYLSRFVNVCAQPFTAFNVTESFSTPSASNLIVTEGAARPTHTFVTGTDTFAVIVFVIVKPVAAVPEIDFVYPATGVSSTVYAIS